jgi:hypothetical protein
METCLLGGRAICCASAEERVIPNKTRTTLQCIIRDIKIYVFYGFSKLVLSTNRLKAIDMPK